jgi:C_GCAxxG_C_C family probable redox protein
LGDCIVLTYFKEFNCAESVLLALSDSLNIKSDCIPRVGTGFGGGMGVGSVCGAVSGAVMAIGLQCGRMDAKEREKRANVYELVEKFMTAFEEKNTSIICQEILGVDTRTKEGIKKYREENLHTRCENCVVTAVQIVQTLLAPGCTGNTL